MRDMNWSDLPALLAVERAGSFSGAAAQLGVNETTVARRIARLSDHLGAPVFARIDGRLRLCDAAAPLLTCAMEAEAAITRASSSVAATRHGPVSLTAVSALITGLILPALPEFLAAHPGLEISLLPGARDFALMRGEADIALRLARPRVEPDVKARRIGVLRYSVYGPKAAPWIRYGPAQSALPQARWLADQAGPSAPVRVTDAASLSAAISAGLGRSILPDILAPNGMQPSAPCPVTRDVWLLMHPDLAQLERMRAVADWLAALMLK
ncbi:LysR family transcriptional regulator [Rubricella aquisinus]|nr:LysR family transcriptional regulator [Rubricella aquisinus]